MLAATFTAAGVLTARWWPAAEGPPPAVRDAAERFLARYVAPDGRVVRRDQGGDTVSEGQAYALLLATAVDDEQRVAAVWGWTVTHLRRPDGLLSWHWADGRVVDSASAADADLDAAHALALAGRRFGRADWSADARTLARAVLDRETARTPLGRQLLAGSWDSGADGPWTLDPSYASPAALPVLARALPDPRWAELDAGWRALDTGLGALGLLPPDWVRLTPDGSLAAVPAPDGAPAGFGLDAARVPVRRALGCSPGAAPDRERDARQAAVLDRPGTVARYDLAGRPAVGWPHPVVLVAAAAARAGAGHPDRASALLDDASALDGRTPTYYGAAWVALGRLILQAPDTIRDAPCSTGPPIDRRV